LKGFSFADAKVITRNICFSHLLLNSLQMQMQKFVLNFCFTFVVFFFLSVSVASPVDSFACELLPLVFRTGQQATVAFS